MNRKLTISIDERVYNGLLGVVGRGSIGKFLEGLARPFVDQAYLENEYAAMAANAEREAEASAWCDNLATDETHAPW